MRGAEGAEGAFLFEVEGSGGAWARLDVAGAATQVGDGGADRRVGEHAKPEREGGGGDVVLMLDPQRRGDRRQVRVGELPVGRPATGGPLPQWRQQPQILPVSQHPGGHTELGGGFSDAHNRKSNILLSKTGPSACATATGSRSVD
jgi:hypothetical protein